MKQQEILEELTAFPIGRVPSSMSLELIVGAAVVGQIPGTLALRAIPDRRAAAGDARDRNLHERP